MVSLQRALFDTNEALHHMGVLPLDKSITEINLAFATVMIFMAVPIIIWLINYISSLDPDNRYTAPFIIGTIFAFFCLAEAYFAILIVLIAIGFLNIIYKYPQYEHIKKYIQSFF
jgi:chromate transport protein ChrA